MSLILYFKVPPDLKLLQNLLHHLLKLVYEKAIFLNYFFAGHFLQTI